MIYIYESCMGHIYYTNEPLEYDDLYCEACGDTANLVGTAKTKEEAVQLFVSQGFWDMDWVDEFVNNIVF